MRQQRPCSQPHGTIARYMSGCSCFDCCEANRLYQQEWKRDKGRMVDASQVRAHVKTLLHNGWRTRGIAEQSGVSYHTVRNLREGNFGRIHRDNAAAILELPLQTPFLTDSTALVPARSTLRLLERLQQHHSLEEIAKACGVSRKALPHKGQHSVQAKNAKRMREAANRLRAERKTA